MGMFGMVLVNEDDYNNYVNMNWESERVKDLERQRDYWKNEFEKAARDPEGFLRGRVYAPKVVERCIEILECCRKA